MSEIWEWIMGWRLWAWMFENQWRAWVAISLAAALMATLFLYAAMRAW